MDRYSAGIYSGFVQDRKSQEAEVYRRYYSGIPRQSTVLRYHTDEMSEVRLMWRNIGVTAAEHEEMYESDYTCKETSWW
jgi:hypothetical protein